MAAWEGRWTLWHSDHSKCLCSVLCRWNLAVTRSLEGHGTHRLLSRSKVMEQMDIGVSHLCLPPIEKTATTWPHFGYQNPLCTVYLLCARLPQFGILLPGSCETGSICDIIPLTGIQRVAEVFNIFEIGSWFWWFETESLVAQVILYALCSCR